MTIRRLSLLSLAFLGCGDDGNKMMMPDAEDFTLGTAPQLAMPCTDQPADVYTVPSGLPAMDDSHRGDVFHCAVAEKLTVPDIKAQIDAYNVGYTNIAQGTVNSGFWTYRIAYRSERNTVNNTRAEGDMAAVLLLPAKPLANAPLVVFGHGSVGVAPKCAPSMLDLSSPTQDQDFPPPLYHLAAYGYTVIAPDYSGFMGGQSPGYFNAEDEAHAILDATRAAAKLLPTPPSKVVFVGHSQGGHSVLAAQSYAKTYGLTGELVAVATFAPMWMSQSLWAAATTPSPYAGLTTATDGNSLLYAMEYAYSASELRAPGTGGDVFQDAKRTDANATILNECYDTAKLQTLGATASDFFTDNYVNVVGVTCAANPFTKDCTDTEAAKWKARWLEDRPALDPSGPPVLAMFGMADTFIKPGRAKCALDKFMRDGASSLVTACMSSNAMHRDIVRGPEADYVNKWIAAKAGAGADPGPCDPFPQLSCETPPNDY